MYSFCSDKNLTIICLKVNSPHKQNVRPMAGTPLLLVFAGKFVYGHPSYGGRQMTN